MNESDKKFVYEFLAGKKLAVISTVGKNNQPESSVIGFAVLDNLNLVFATISSSSRKYVNLQKNKHVALVIGWDNSETAQYEGSAAELKGKEHEEYKKIYYQKNPQAIKWESEKDNRFFLIKPKWIRYSDYDGKPHKIIELKF